jgi:hypothetical protein
MITSWLQFSFKKAAMKELPVYTSPVVTLITLIFKGVFGDKDAAKPFLLLG